MSAMGQTTTCPRFSVAEDELKKVRSRIVVFVNQEVV